jgi:tetratricopeptide (TPR) repeat protein
MENDLRRWEIAGIVATAVIVLSLPLYLLKEGYFQGRAGEETVPAAAYVGRGKCVDCHREVSERWKGSHHDLAMDFATEKTVLGNFDDALFEYEGVTSRFFRKDGKFYVNTEGPDGEPGDFEIAYTFGVYPLQQYLVPFPGGRLQSLTIAWDVDRKRWYRLPPFDVAGPDDWLHWTGGGQTWNLMCAECHSTDLRKNYDPSSDTYETTWGEIDVSCEACHGPGSLHVAWADRPPMARTPLERYGLVLSTEDQSARGQVELCAPCHSRRMLLGEIRHGGADLLDGLLPEILSRGMYFADGQIIEEVYVYGSFIQSRMYDRGIRCSDCHDVHSLKRLKEGNDLCLQCHRADVYNTADHHFHKETHEGKPSDGWLCEKCHMPGKHYMGIDYRLDHSIRVPRPDLSLELGLPNSCGMTGCHDDKDAAWSAEAYRKWYGLKRKPHYGTVLAAGRRGDPEALEDLVRLAGDPLFPAIVRSSALTLLAAYRGEESTRAIEKALGDDESLLRHTALRQLDAFPSDRLVGLATPLLYDSVRAVRQQAGVVLTRTEPGKMSPGHREFFEAAWRDYRDSMVYSADFPSAQMNLGNLAANLGSDDDAVSHYLRAIEIDDRFYPALNNLALLYNRLGKNGDAEKLLKRILALEPDFHEVSYSLGLLLAEEKRFEEAAAYLERAAVGLPQRPRISYNLGLLLQYLRRMPEAEAALTRALRGDPDNPDFLFALADFLVKEGRLEEALQAASRMLEIDPSNGAARQILQFIEQVRQRGSQR